MASVLFLSQRPACEDAPEEIFFPNTTAISTKNLQEAKEYCLRCPVSRECIIAALELEPKGVIFKSGIQAGTTPTDRVELQELYQSGKNWEQRWIELFVLRTKRKRKSKIDEWVF